MSTQSSTRINLEPAAQALVEATGTPPFLFQLPIEEGRATLEQLQSDDVPVPLVDVEDIRVPTPKGDVDVRIARPPNRHDPLPVLLYIHGAGWVFGSKHTHDRLIRELSAGIGCALVFPSYDLSPEARYPTAIEQNYAVLEWIAAQGTADGLDPARIAVAGDSVGGNMATAMTLLAKQRSGPRLAAQLLFYPVTDAAFDTESYLEFGEGYYLRRDGMQWFWDQYIDNPQDRDEVTASPLRATRDQLTGLPPALVITCEADVLRDEGEAYAQRLRDAGVPVTAVRYQAIIHDFVMLNALRSTAAAQAAITQAVWFVSSALHSRP